MQFNQIIPKKVPKHWFKVPVFLLMMLWFANAKAQQLVDVTVKVTETFNDYDCCNDAAGICGFTNDSPEPRWKIRVRPYTNPTFSPMATILSSTCGTRTWDRTIGTYNDICEDRVVFEVQSWEEDGCGSDEEFNDDGLCGVFNADDIYSGTQSFTRTFLGGGPGTKTFVLGLSNGYSITCDVTWSRVGLNVITAANRSVCRGDKATLTAVNNDPDVNVIAFRWYKDAALQDLAFTGNPFPTPNIFADRSYWVTGVLEGGCETNPKKVDVTVIEKPVAPIAPAVQTCLNGQALLTARSPIVGAIFTWYDDALGNVPLASGNTFLTPPLSAPRSYWVSVKDPVATCPSNLREVPVTVDLVLNAPIAENVTICEGEEAVLTASASSSAEIRWYADEELTNLLFIGSEFKVSPTTNTTYYLTQAVNGCTSGSSSVNVIVNPKPITPLSAQTNICSNAGSVNITITPPEGHTVNIYENGVFKLNTSGFFIYNFSTAPISFTTIEYSYVNSTTGCESDRANYYIVPYDDVEAPTAPNVSLCVNEEGQIISNGSSQATQIRFYASDASTLLETDLGNRGSYDVSFVSQGTYTYYTSAVSANGCESEKMRVDVNVGSGAPTIAPTADDVTICNGERAVITATGSVGGAMYWYSDAALSNLLFVGNPFETLPLTSNAMFYVAEGAGACGSSEATLVNVTVNPAANLPFATADYTICQGQTVPSGEGLSATCSDASTGSINNSIFSGTASFPISIGALAGVGGTVSFDATSIPAGSTVIDISLAVTMAHTWAEDVLLDLSSPGGSTANIVGYNAGNDNFGTTGVTPLTYIFNESASNYIVGTLGNNDIPSGSYLPNESFSVFTGTNASGMWSLEVDDAFDGDGGILSDAILSITYQLPADAGSLTWWDALAGGSQVGTGSPFVPADYESLPVGQHTFYAQCDDASTCGNKRIAVNFNVLPSIASPLVSGDDAVCEGEQANFTVSNPANTVEWYADDELSVLLGTGSSFISPPLNETTTFYVVNNNGNCSSESTSITVEVNPLPTTEIYADPSPSFFSGNIEICEGGLVTLEVVLEDPFNQVALLYTEEEPGNLRADWLLASEQYFEINTMSDMIYYVRVYDMMTGCFSKAVPIYIDVFDKPNDVEVRGTTICVDETAIVHADVTTLFDNPDDNAQVMVYIADEDGIIIDAQDVPLGVSSFNIDFDLGTFSDPGVYNFLITTANGYGCFGTPQVVTVTVVDGPSSPRVTNDFVCSGETAMLRAVTNEGIVHWYPSMSSTDVLQVGGVFTIPNAIANATYYVSAVNEAGCESPRVPVGVTVYTKPEAPEVEAEEQVICLGQTAIFTITNADPDLVYVWSSDPLGVDIWGTGETFETPPLSQYTAFYVTAIDPETGCTSNPTAAWVIVDNTLVISSATAEPACEGNDVHIQVATWDVVGAVALYDWDLNLVDVAFIPDDDDGDDQTPWIADFYQSNLAVGEYIYYVKEFGDYFFPCGSIPTSVLVKVLENPEAPSVVNDTVCKGDAARLLAASVDGTINWYMSSSSDVVLHTGAIFDIPVANSNSTYWVSVVNANGCESERVPVSLLVNALPETPEIEDVSACYGTPTDLEVSNEDEDLLYEWATDPDFVYSFGLGGGTFTTGALFQNTTYYVRSIDPLTGCTSPAVGVRIFIDNTLIISNPVSDPVCEGSDAVIKVSAWDVDAVVGLFDWNLELVEIAILSDGDPGDDNSPWVADFYISDLPAGEYIYYVFEIGNELYPCGSIPISVLVRVLEGPSKPDAMNDSPTCEGGDVLVSATAEDASIYSWSGPNSFNSNAQTFILNDVTLGHAGDYIVTVYDLSGCSASDTTTVVVNPSPALGEGQEPSYNAPLCERDTLKLTVGLVDNATYIWVAPNGMKYYTREVQIPDVKESDDQGFYSVQITDTLSGCKSQWYSILVNINKRPDNVIAVNDGPKCAGEDIQLSTGKVYNAEYTWTGPNQFTSLDRTPIIENIQQENAGIYTVVVSVDGCSSDPATTEVIVYPNPIADAGKDDTTEHGTPIQLNGSGGITYQWTPNVYIAPSNNVPNPFVNPPLGNNTFVLTVWNEYGCSDADEVVITVLPTDKLDIPEVFTPNGDGKNDTWIIGFLSDIGEYQLCIYSRDGAQLFCTKNYENDWDGTYKGDELPDGTYWYVITSSEHTYKGAVTIRR
jgi:gliding motility-associated-like protein